MGGDRRSVLKAERDWLAALVAQDNDLTLERIAARLLAARGVKADAPMLSRFFKAQGISFKKNRARRRAKAPRRCAQA
jgi:transposase